MDTPEIDKLSKAMDEGGYDFIAEFVEWLRGPGGYVVARHHSETHFRKCYCRDGRMATFKTVKHPKGGTSKLPTGNYEICTKCNGMGEFEETTDPVLVDVFTSNVALLGEFFNIDSKALNRERDAILKRLRDGD